MKMPADRSDNEGGKIKIKIKMKIKMLADRSVSVDGKIKMKMKYHSLLIFLLGSLSSFSQVLNTDQSSTYAVVVGISDYQDEAIPDLRFADKDALAFAGFLQSPAGGSLDEDHLKVLINEQATVARFAIALDWLWEVVKENDKVIIYFSGHGDVERKSLTQPGFLLCWDAPARVYLAGGTLALPMFQEVISTLSIQNKAKVIVITDACRSGKLSGSSVGGSQLTSTNLAKQYANEIKILSCQPDEYSIEGEQWGGGRGAFSYHLLEGLYGMADGNEDMNVNLKEIGRYLEDKVAEEVAPQSQNPMTIGSKTENLTMVFPEILAQLKEGKKGQLQLFTASESKGIEEEVLSQADTSIVEMYFAFQKAIEDKQFLEPTTACADFYYKKLSQEPQLEKLHSSMRRNYAAALQDDAQQVMNNWLKHVVSELSLSKLSQAEKYKPYPTYLDRAAELLGKDHYMYAVLKARRLYFEAYLMHIHLRNKDQELGEKILSKYREALKWQPNAPHVHSSMSQVYYWQMHQPDSAEYCAHRATELAPSWLLPYSNMGFQYAEVKINREKAEYFLTLVDQIDSTAIESNSYHIMNWGVFYYRTQQYSQAEILFKKGLQLNPDNVHVHTLLGNVYTNINRYAESEQYFKKAILLDSTSHYPYFNLGLLYQKLNRFPEAEAAYQKAIQLDSSNATAYNNLGNIYMETQRYKKAEEMYKKSVELDPAQWMAFSNLGLLYHYLQRWEEAAVMTQKAIDLMPNDGGLYGELAYALSYISGRTDEATAAFEKAKKLSPKWPDTYLFWAQFLLRSHLSNEESAPPKAMVYHYLQKAFENGLGKNGLLNVEEIKTKNDFKAIRAEPIWKELMKKYFPDQYKD